VDVGELEVGVEFDKVGVDLAGAVNPETRLADHKDRVCGLSTGDFEYWVFRL
jgi:hypothetical protein